MSRFLAPSALVLAALADSLTFLALPPGAEANPIAAAFPLVALAAKAALTTALLLWPWRYATPIRMVGAIVWAIGAAANVAVIL